LICSVYRRIVWFIERDKTMQICLSHVCHRQMRIHPIYRCWTLWNWFRARNQFPSVLSISGIERNSRESVRIRRNLIPGIEWNWFRNVQQRGIGWLLIVSKTSRKNLGLGCSSTFFFCDAGSLYWRQKKSDITNFVGINVFWIRFH
jgi:hypothetical protein